MPKAIMLVYTDPSSPERDAEFNQWYDDVHVGDVLKVPGILSGTRYRLVTSPEPGAQPPGTYLGVYEVEADDLNDIAAGLAKAYMNGELPMSDVITTGPIVFFEEVAPKSLA